MNSLALIVILYSQLLYAENNNEIKEFDRLPGFYMNSEEDFKRAVEKVIDEYVQRNFNCCEDLEEDSGSCDNCNEISNC